MRVLLSEGNQAKILQISSKLGMSYSDVVNMVLESVEMIDFERVANITTKGLASDGRTAKHRLVIRNRWSMNI